MQKKITIAKEHSSRNPKGKLEIELSGGSPWFAYIWIDDKCYTVTLRERSVQIKLTR